MKNNIKNTIFMGVFFFGFFGIYSFVSAEFSNYYYQPIPDAYTTYSAPSYNQYAVNNPDYFGYQNNNNYNNSNYYNNGYNQNTVNTVSNQNTQPQIVYASDVETKKVDFYMPTLQGVSVPKAKTTSSNKINTTTTNTTNTVSQKTSNTVLNGENVVSGSDLDSRNNANGVVALSLYGTNDFLPDTIFEWILIFFLILIVIILIRLITKKRHQVQ